eukprot:2233130-Prymnesium_polylepis.1
MFSLKRAKRESHKVRSTALLRSWSCRVLSRLGERRRRGVRRPDTAERRSEHLSAHAMRQFSESGATG